jgi:hypothetical protein
MPSKERRERERLQEERNKEWDQDLPKVPDRVIAQKVAQRLGVDLPSGLSEALYTKGQHNAAWSKYDERGQYIIREDPEDLGANSNRKSTREDDAILLREKYPDIWGKRGKAKIIAGNEKNLDIRTVQK